jgi:hypothetical protein
MAWVSQKFSRERRLDREIEHAIGYTGKDSFIGSIEDANINHRLSYRPSFPLLQAAGNMAFFDVKVLPAQGPR